MSKRLLQITLLCLIAVTMLGADDNSTTRVDRIGHKLVCQCGCGQILMECNHVGCPVSGPMIENLKAQLASGASEKTILDSFIAKYGPIVLAAPIRGGFDNAAWIVPFAALALATLGVALLIRFWNRRHALLPADGPEITPLPTSESLRERIRRDTDL